MPNALKKYVATFKIYNGETTYTMPVKIEAESKIEAEKYFKNYICNTDLEIWKLINFEEVKTFEDLWRLI